jgi:hypothetical protein
MEVPTLTIDKTPSVNLDALSMEALKEKYFECLHSLSKKTTPLRQIVLCLLTRGVHWKDLVQWAKDHGQNDKYIRKVLSEILTDLGIRRRKPGAGRETPQDALALLAYARTQYGGQAIKLLGAAHRAGKATEARKCSALPLPNRQAA